MFCAVCIATSSCGSSKLKANKIKNENKGKRDANLVYSSSGLGQQATVSGDYSQLLQGGGGGGAFSLQQAYGGQQLGGQHQTIQLPPITLNAGHAGQSFLLGGSSLGGSGLSGLGGLASLGGGKLSYLGGGGQSYQAVGHGLSAAALQGHQNVAPQFIGAGGQPSSSLAGALQSYGIQSSATAHGSPAGLSALTGGHQLSLGGGEHGGAQQYAQLQSGGQHGGYLLSGGGGGGSHGLQFGSQYGSLGGQGLTGASYSVGGLSGGNVKSGPVTFGTASSSPPAATYGIPSGSYQLPSGSSYASQLGSGLQYSQGQPSYLSGSFGSHGGLTSGFTSGYAGHGSLSAGQENVPIYATGIKGLGHYSTQGSQQSSIFQLPSSKYTPYSFGGGKTMALAYTAVPSTVRHTSAIPASYSGLTGGKSLFRPSVFLGSSQDQSGHDLSAYTAGSNLQKSYLSPSSSYLPSHQSFGGSFGDSASNYNTIDYSSGGH